MTKTMKCSLAVNQKSKKHESMLEDFLAGFNCIAHVFSEPCKRPVRVHRHVYISYAHNAGFAADLKNLTADFNKSVSTVLEATRRNG